ncbi:hypothetical protein [Pectobacterium cacticida]|uniref:hypothetical protein n=1 Tax=Pectobacterium cacticida TaxID=69221 RepID=UPI00398744D8
MATLYRLLRNLVMGVIIAVGAGIWFIFGSGSDSGPNVEFYRQENNTLYERLTDDIVKGAPRISPVYRFVHYSPVGAAAEVSAVYFENITDIAPLKGYLASLGCTLEMTEANVEMWLSHDKSKAITLAVDVEGRTVALEIRSPPPPWWR